MAIIPHVDEICTERFAFFSHALTIRRELAPASVTGSSSPRGVRAVRINFPRGVDAVFSRTGWRAQALTRRGEASARIAPGFLALRRGLSGGQQLPTSREGRSDQLSPGGGCWSPGGGVPTRGEGLPGRGAAFPGGGKREGERWGTLGRRQCLARAGGCGGARARRWRCACLSACLRALRGACGVFFRRESACMRV
jgi:hypothetical protein